MRAIQLSDAVPDTGWKIASWTGTDDDSSTEATNSLTMPANDHSVAVNYTQIEYTLTVVSAHGPVDVSQAAPYHYNDSVVLTMGTVDAGWTFTGWSEPSCIGTGPCTVTITGDTTVTANFTQIEYALTITQATGGTITAEPGWSIPPE